LFSFLFKKFRKLITKILIFLLITEFLLAIAMFYHCFAKMSIKKRKKLFFIIPRKKILPGNMQATHELLHTSLKMDNYRQRY